MIITQNDMNKRLITDLKKHRLESVKLDEYSIYIKFIVSSTYEVRYLLDIKDFKPIQRGIFDNGVLSMQYTPRYHIWVKRYN